MGAARRLFALPKAAIMRIKIDGSYVAAMGQSRQAAVMLKALIAIGQGLDLKVIADGVVTEEQKSALASQGCEEAQGALFGEALNAKQAAALVQRSAARAAV